MSESFALKRIASAAIPAAVNKAKHYRLLNDPQQAESICLDVLEVEPDHQEALVVLVLAMTDQFGTGRGPPAYVARDYLRRIDDPYQRHYYEGLIREREARAILAGPMGSKLVYDSFTAALACYERAITLRPADDDEAVLRWNACVRTIERAHLQPPPVEVEQPLE